MIELLDGRVSLHTGDCLDILETMEPDSVDCVVTSPPYWGLRDYGVGGQIGLEPTLAEHLAVMVRVFEAVKRVLKPTGTCWVNYGDCYATTPNGRSAADTKATGNDDRTFRDKPFSTIQGVLKAKDLCMVPNRFAIALQEAGWWVRAENVWGKPNPMPESIRDRPATSHEKVFMFTKSSRYFYDAEAVRQGRVSEGEYKTPDGWDTGRGGHGSIHRNGRQKGETVAEKKAKKSGATPRNDGARWNENNGRGFKPRGHKREHEGFRDDWDNRTKAEQQVNGRNLRNYEPAPLDVWHIATRPFSEAHFATFPPELAERCILAGCPKGGLVLDPFGGAGTTALVALRHGRKASLIELNPEYAEITQRRIEKEWRVQPKSKSNNHGPLFAEDAA